MEEPLGNSGGRKMDELVTAVNLWLHNMAIRAAGDEGEDGDACQADTGTDGEGKHTEIDGCRDSDGDGVDNDVDDCPATPVGSVVDAAGCADLQLDDDGDGVANHIDDCPGSAADAVTDDSGRADSQPAPAADGGRD